MNVFVAGERVRRAATGEDGVVLSAGDGALVQVAFASGTVWIHPEELEKLPEGPTERLAAGELGHAEPYGLRLQSLYLKHAYRYDPLTGLSSARIEPQLHQVFVAHQVTQKLQPRMILADEVGLGKTIEAGLIIKELRARELIGRVLIIVPPACSCSGRANCGPSSTRSSRSSTAPRCSTSAAAAGTRGWPGRT